MLNPRSLMAVLVAATAAATANAHFIYIIPPEPGGSQVQVVFGEGAEADENNEMLKYLDGIELKNGSEDQTVSLKPGEGALVGEGGDTRVFSTSKTFGIMSRGGPAFLLEYYAKGGPMADQWSWQRESGLRLDVTPELTDNGDIELLVTFDGKPAAGVEVVYDTANDADAVDTNDKGIVVLKNPAAGLVSVRAKHVDETAGEYEGKPYESVKHYSTCVFRVEGATSEEAVVVRGTATNYPELPREITSFGAALLDRTVYVYGGHTGSAHSYSMQEQANELWSLDLDQPEAGWVTRIEGPHLQGNALVAVDGKVVLIGGFTAMNAEEEDHDLHSQSNVRAFDPKTGKWSDLPSLPEPRSSFDAVVLNDTIYVAGGWSMQGEEDSVWHQTAWKLDLAADEPVWQSLAPVPFQRRALALAAHNGKVYVLGGMSMSDGPTTNVTIYDPASDSWAEGPKLRGVTMNGFGCAAFATGGRLYATTFDGKVQRLSVDGAAWDVVGKMPKKRFFHRLIPASDSELLIFGGGDMAVGKYPDVDRLEIVDEPTAATAKVDRSN